MADEQLRRRLERLLPLSGDERVLDVGASTGALTAALAPSVGEVVRLDLELDPEQLGRLPFDRGSFDVVTCVGILHRVGRPEVVLSELVRVTRLGGRLLVVDRLAAIDPLVALERDRAERMLDPTHTRLLMDGDLRAMFEMNGLVLLSAETVREPREQVEVGWYVLRR
jgi:ubiquinone/menaquinone biosynthesis C-methylase UbiE